jgi:membrane protein CcdC involved in cytochrome C biogenesis
MKKGIIIGVIGFVVVGAAVVIIGLGSKTKPSSTQSVTTTKQS